MSHSTFDIVRALLYAARTCSLSDRVSAVVAGVLPNRVVYWALVRSANCFGGRPSRLRPIGVVAARLRYELLEGRQP